MAQEAATYSTALTSPCTPARSCYEFYGIYDIATNTSWVNVGTDHDTSEFAVESIRCWWQRRGRVDHPDATRLLITADSGGSNDPRRWTWKKHLHAFAQESGLEITVCHFPPGTQCRCLTTELSRGAA